MDTNETERYNSMDEEERLVYLIENIDRLTRELVQAPNSKELYLKRAELYSLNAWESNFEPGRIENYQLALADVNKVLELDPQSAQAYYQRTVIYNVLLQDDPARADKVLSDIKQAIQLGYEPLEDAYLRLGWAYAFHNKPAEAIEAYSWVITHSTNPTFDQWMDAYYNRALQYAVLKQFHKILSDMMYCTAKLKTLKQEMGVKTEDINQGFVWIFTLLSNVLYAFHQEGRNSEGIPILRNFLSKLPKDQLNNEKLNMILSFFFLHEFENITADTVYSDDWVFYTYRPYIEFKQELGKLGCVFDRQFVELFDSQDRLERLHNDEDRLAAATVLKAFVPSAGLFRRAKLFKEQGTKYLRKISSLDTWDQQQEKRATARPFFANAVKDIQAYFAIPSTNLDEVREAYQIAAVSFEEIGDYQSAVVAYTSFIELTGDTISAEELAALYTRRAEIYRDHFKQYQQAIDDYSMAMKIDPAHDSLRSWFHYRGLCYEELGDLTQAERDLQVVVKLGRSSEHYRDDLARVQRKLRERQ